MKVFYFQIPQMASFVSGVDNVQTIDAMVADHILKDKYVAINKAYNNFMDEPYVYLQTFSEFNRCLLCVCLSCFLFCFLVCVRA